MEGSKGGEGREKEPLPLQIDPQWYVRCATLQWSTIHLGKGDRACPMSPPPSGDAIVGIPPPSHVPPAIPLTSSRASPHQYRSGRMLGRGKSLPRLPLISFICFIYLNIINIVLAGSKSVTINICEIKYLKNKTPCKTRNAVDPAKRALKRTIIESTMLDFRSGESEHFQLHRADQLPLTREKYGRDF